MLSISSQPEFVTEQQAAKIKAVALRVEILLREILAETQHGEIAIRVERGVIEISGGPRHKIT